MRLLLTRPELIPDLVQALNETDCVAVRTGARTVEVLALWLLDGGDPGQAATELVFFVRAWAAAHPGADALMVV